MFYIFQFQYVANTASSNRLMGYLRSLDSLGIETSVIYMYPDNHYSRVQYTFQHIHIEYLWRNKNILYFSYLKRFTYKRYINKFIRRLKPNDIVYTYAISDLMKQVQRIKGVKTYGEITEHPNAVNGGFESPLTSLSMNDKYDVCRKLDGLFVISSELKNYFIDQGVSENKIHIINMIVDPSRFGYLEKQKRRDRYIAYCGTASNNKDGVDILIKAFAIVSRAIKDIKLYIIGPVPTQDRSGNLELIKQLNLRDKVILTGMMESVAIPQILKDAEVLALARPNNLQARYGFPTKLGEYLLTENPVVVTKVGDISLFLNDNDSALLCEPDNVEDFAAKLEWALIHPNEASLIGYKGAQIARRYFNSEIETRKIAYYMGLL